MYMWTIWSSYIDCIPPCSIGISCYIQAATACQAHPIPADRAGLSQCTTGTTPIWSIPTSLTQGGGHQEVSGRCGTSRTTGEHCVCHCIWQT